MNLAIKLVMCGMIFTAKTPVKKSRQSPLSIAGAFIGASGINDDG